MIYVTGDTHGKLLKLREFAQEFGATLTRDDYVIVAGDFGFVFFPEMVDDNLKRLAKLPFTVLFVDGNHENFDLLEAYPEEEWKGGKVHRLSENVLHLMRGQIFDIDGKRILAFGGAESTDREGRKDGYSWWEQEKVTQADVDEAIRNLDRCDRKVDYVITHSCSSSLKQLYFYVFRRYNISSEIYSEQPFIGTVENYIEEYRQWYFGHFHFDADIDGKHRALYEDFVELE